MTDLFLTHEGDLALTPIGDLQRARGLAEILQTIAIRLKTRQGTFPLRPELGHVLDELVGEFLTEGALRRGEQLIYRALSGSLVLSSIPLEVRGAPVNEAQAIFVVSFPFDGVPRLFTIPFDFQHGALVARTAAVGDPSVGGQLSVPAIGIDPLES